MEIMQIETNKRYSRIKGSNGTLSNAFKEGFRISECVKRRAEFSSKYGKASKRDVQTGFEQIYVHNINAKKTSPNEYVWGNVDEDYATLSSFSPGSLGNFLLEVHRLGFRVFPTSASTKSFLASSSISTYEKAMKASFENSEFAEQVSKTISIEDLYKQLTTSFRGKGDKVSVEPLLTRFATWLTGKTYSQIKPENKIKPLIHELADAFLDFELWSEITADLENSSLIIVNVLSRHLENTKVISQGLETIDSAIKQTNPTFRYATIAYDYSVPKFKDLNSEETIMGLCAFYAHEARKNGSQIKAYVQGHITTTNANGLGWLFGRGLKIIEESTVEDLQENLGIPQDDQGKKIAKNLKQIVKDLTPLHIFEKASYLDYRTVIQGLIDSTIANHLSRLESTLSSFSSEVDFDHIQASIEQANKDLKNKKVPGQESIANPLNYLVTNHENICRQYNILLGNIDESEFSAVMIRSAIEQIQKYNETIEYFSGVCQSINAAVKHANNSSQIKTPAAWGNIISLPKFNEQIKSVIEDRKCLAKEAAKNKKQMECLIIKLTEEHKLCNAASLKMRAEQFKEFCIGSKRKALSDPLVVAQRDILARVFSCINRASDGCRNAAIACLNGLPGYPTEKTQQKYWKEHIQNRQHFFFVHPLDRKLKMLIPFDEGCIGNFDSIAYIDSLLQSNTVLSEKDRSQLLITKSSILMLGLPDRVSTSFVKEIVDAQNVPTRFSDCLNYDTIDRPMFIQLVTSILKASIDGQQFRLNKKKFNHTRTLKHLTGNQLYYVPKDKAWKVPTQMYEGRFSSVLESSDIIWDSDGVINSVETCKKIAKTWKTNINKTVFLSFLRELPHSFFIGAGIKNCGRSCFALNIDKGDIKSGETQGLVQVKIDRTHEKLKKAIDTIFDGAKLSPPQVQLTRHYEVNDQQQVIEQKQKRQLIFQLPVSSNTEATEGAEWNPKHVIGIDPGSYGLGVSLLDLEGNIKDAGFIHINSLISYDNLKTRHEKRDQPRQEYRATYSNSLQKSMESASGDICYVIDRLMMHFNAIPVFESVTGDRQPYEQVFKNVQARYCFGENDSHTAKRVQHWRGAFNFSTPLLRKVLGSKNHKPFIAAPGVYVSSYGNSFTCSKCGNNGIELLKEYVENNNSAKISGGVLDLNGESLTLSMPNPATVVERKKKNLSPEWVTIGNKSFKNLKKGSPETRELMSLIRKSVRRPHENRNAKQGSDSVFCCPFCQHTANADGVAAINIANKFISQLV